MVESVKPRGANGAPQVSSESLRNNFKNISSGLNVGEKSQTNSSTRVTPATPSDKDQVNGIVQNLKDAVDFSARALKSLENVAKSDAPMTVNLHAVQSFAIGLDKLRGDVRDVLEDLRRKAETAEVYSENLSSADAQIEDVESAQSQAAKTGSKITFDTEKAVDAHSPLSAAKVASLLLE